LAVVAGMKKTNDHAEFYDGNKSLISIFHVTIRHLISSGLC